MKQMTEKELKQSKEKIRIAIEQFKLSDEQCKQIIELIKQVGNIPEYVKKTKKPLELALKASQLNVKNMLNFDETTMLVSFSNFLFGRMYGQIELIVRLLSEKNPDVLDLNEFMK